MSRRPFFAGVAAALAMLSLHSVAVSGTAPSQKGVASYYADKFQGRKTASGQSFKQEALTGAHRTLPLGTKVRVTNLKNGKSVEVEINDRGPFIKGRIMDISKRAAREIGMVRSGIAQVRVEVVGASDGA